MNTLVIVVIAACCLAAGYLLYGRWLAHKWGIDPNAKTPAVTKEDGQDYVPTDGWVVFAHQFSSIAGAGPVTGAIQAAVFGWVPVFLWIILGGIFFGAVTDFGALYASVKNEGKSMGLLIEQYIGKTGKKLFLLFCWLFTLIVTAAFADMVAGTFNAYETIDGVTSLSAAATVNGAAGSISLLFIAFAVVFGLIQKKAQFHGWKQTLLGLVCTVAAFVIGMNCPLITTKANWSYMVFAYIFLAAVLPMWLLMEPRDLMTTFMFAGMIIGAVVGLLVAHPAMNLAPYTGFHNEKSGDLFPILFVTVACGAVSGFHSLVSSGTSSKAITNEKDMPKVGFGAMLLESLLAVLALCVAGAAASADGTPATGTPFAIFSSGVAGFLEMFGIPVVTSTDPRHTGIVDSGTIETTEPGGTVSKWPNNMGIAATFDADTAYTYGDITAAEYRALGIQMMLGPQMDLITDPRWSRDSSAFSEDPELAADMSSAFIEAMQTDDNYQESDWGIDEGWGTGSVATIAKHWPSGGTGEFGFDAHKDDGKFGVYPAGNF